MKPNLDGTPRPHYVKSLEELTPDGFHLTGQVVFPSTDETIGDRGDHVNVAHHLFALWNAAHLMAQRQGLKKLRAFETQTTSRRPTLPDKPVRLEAEATIEREEDGKVFGLLIASFSDAGRLLCEVNVRYVAERVSV